jgi:hypothetical protein
MKPIQFEKDTIKIKDLYLISFIKMKGHNEIETENIHGKTFFVFENIQEIMNICYSYMLKRELETKINLHKLINIIQTTKRKLTNKNGMIRNEKQEYINN